MKIAITSDIHLSHAPFKIKNTEKADVLILGGDIEGKPDFFKKCSDEYEHVILIAGNHEFYNHDLIQTLFDIEDMVEDYPNIYFLENNTKTINDITFIGSVLWTDMNKQDSLTMWHIRRMMWDFQCIKYKGRTFTPEDSVEFHRQALNYMRVIMEEKHDDKFVVVTHHSPSIRSIHETYKNSFLLNGGFHSDCDDFIIDRPQIKLWIHGHTHFPFDYMINETRIVCNPRGYVPYERKESDKYLPKIVEV